MESETSRYIALAYVSPGIEQRYAMRSVTGRGRVSLMENKKLTQNVHEHFSVVFLTYNIINNIIQL